MAKSLKIPPGDEASFPSRGPKRTQATGWGLAVNGEAAAVPGPRDHRGVGVGATCWPRPQALTVSGRCPCHPSQVPTTSQCPVAQPTPRATRSPSVSGRPWSPAARSALANASSRGQGLGPSAPALKP